MNIIVLLRLLTIKKEINIKLFFHLKNIFQEFKPNVSMIKMLKEYLKIYVRSD